MIDKARLTARMQTDGIDTLVASSLENVYYTSGLWDSTQELLGDAAFSIWTNNHEAPILILPAVDATHIIDADLNYERVYTYGSFYLYETGDMTDQDRELQRLISEHNYATGMDALISVLKSHTDSGDMIVVEEAGLLPSQWNTLRNEITDAEIRPADSLLADLRRIKTDEEVRRLRESVQINQESIIAAIDDVELGMTERDLLQTYHHHLLQRGAEPLFAVVAFGSHSAYPHAVPGDRQLQTGDLIRFDVGCTYKHYASDIARTFAYREVDDNIKEKYRVLNSGMNHSISLLQDGVDTREIFEQTLEFIQEQGADVFDSFDRNHFGHGIGIDVYDAPTINQDSNEIRDGMVMCIEPPYYELGFGGLQVEDEVLITGDGTKRFTEAPDELPVIE